MNPSPEQLAVQTLRAGDYQLQLSAAGGGLSEWRGLALNRWPGDALEDAHGSFIYLRDADSGALWSAAQQPGACAQSARSRTLPAASRSSWPPTAAMSGGV